MDDRLQAVVDGYDAATIVEIIELSPEDIVDNFRDEVIAKIGLFFPDMEE